MAAMAASLAVVAVLLAGTAVARGASCPRRPAASDAVIELVADLMPNLMDLVNAPELAHTLGIAKEIATSRWTSKEVAMSDLVSAGRAFAATGSARHECATSFLSNFRKRPLCSPRRFARTFRANWAPR